MRVDSPALKFPWTTVLTVSVLTIDDHSANEFSGVARDDNCAEFSIQSGS